MNTKLQDCALRFSLPGLLALVFIIFMAAGPVGQMASAQTGGVVPGNTQGTSADSDFWREIRRGQQGTVSIPNKQSGQLIQSDGDRFRTIRNGPLVTLGGWLMLGTVALLALFYAGRGRIAIDHGPSGRTIERFTDFERMSHWILAVSFIILAITGLNILYGKYVLLPIIGRDAFAALAGIGKWLHNFLAFGFMLGLVLIFFRWVRHNIPNRDDLTWIAQAGGLFSKGNHPPARKFNAGQKFIFWMVILCGVSISLTGISLMFPGETSMFEATLAFLNTIGFKNMPTELSTMTEMHYSQLWHSIVALVFIALILAHIYIGSMGMEGAFDAMGTGQVDTNWAKEHHSIWVEELERSGQLGEAEATAQPPAE